MGSGIIEVIQGDITQMDVDAIVNAANSRLSGGGGVDGAIHRAGGPSIMAACDVIVRKQGGCPTGQAVITTAGKLKAKYVIHTVGPVWSGGTNNEDALLAACYRNSLRLARENGCRTIAFPNISTGVYGFPRQRAADISVSAVKEFLSHSDTFDRVIFVCFENENYQLVQNILDIQ